MKSLFISILFVIMFVSNTKSQTVVSIAGKDIIGWTSTLYGTYSSIFGNRYTLGDDIDYKKKTVENKLKSITSSSYIYKVKKQKEELRNKSVYKFDVRGNVIEEAKYNKHNELRRKDRYEYNDSDKCTLIERTKKDNRIKYKRTTKYNTHGDELESVKYDKKGERKNIETTEYNSNNKITLSTYYKKYGKKFKYKYVYVYNESGELSKTTTYKKNGEVDHEWIYDCNPTGVSVNKHKDTTRVCKKIETDSAGNRVEIQLTTGFKNKVYKTITKYDKNNNMIDQINYNADDEIRFRLKNTYNSHNKRTETIAYRKGNKTWYHNACKYDSNDNLIEYTDYKMNDKGIRSKTNYTYNDKKQCASYTECYDNNPKKCITSEYKYGNKPIPEEIKYTGKKKNKKYNYTKFNYEFY